METQILIEEAQATMLGSESHITYQNYQESPELGATPGRQPPELAYRAALRRARRLARALEEKYTPDRRAENPRLGTTREQHAKHQKRIKMFLSGMEEAIPWAEELVDYAGLRNDVVEAGRRLGRRGRLTPEQVLEIRAAKGKRRQVDLAAQYGVSQGTISGIQRQRDRTYGWVEDPSE